MIRHCLLMQLNNLDVFGSFKEEEHKGLLSLHYGKCISIRYFANWPDKYLLPVGVIYNVHVIFAAL